MAVYVDALGWNGWKLYGQAVKSCHLMADSKPELIAFATKLGLRHSWVQGLNDYGRVPHFDLVQSKRTRALELGALTISGRELISLMDRIRNR
ncbi:MAG: DUF4031 domain-containing protein [Candidatus Eisenbacteria bacterium]|nr:DUF4031 domain-containing protein [Candidatus Eisenbacteria bacterium]